MTSPSEITRERVLKAAHHLFADRGYQDTSVRAVVAKARVNQAAINYHFGGKDGLYREVLRTAIRALTEHQLAHAEEMKRMSRENALAEFIKHQLRQLASRDEISRHYRIFDWEGVRPTAVYRKLVTEEATPFLSFATDLVRRFMPSADQRTLTIAAIWLVGQCSVFVRNWRQLANPPVSLDFDEAGVDRLTTLVGAWALAGLAHAEPSKNLVAHESACPLDSSGDPTRRFASMSRPRDCLTETGALIPTLDCEMSAKS